MDPISEGDRTPKDERTEGTVAQNTRLVRFRGQKFRKGREVPYIIPTYSGLSIVDVKR
jgi:hypothetical protein